MPLVSMTEMLKRAKDEKYAVGQFNINNLEWTQAILDQAQEMNSPVILGVSASAAKYMGGWNTVVMMVKGLMADKGYTIPVAIHLDHGASFEDCKAAIDAGFTSVMIDASHYAFEENIQVTKKVVDYAHERNVSVEAELGRVGGQEDEVVADTMYAVPSECKALVDATGIDCLAPALGSVHGPYKGEPKLGFDEMLEIKELTNMPLVLHGGSGIPDEQIQKAIARGTTKINVNTEKQQAFTGIIRKILTEKPELYDPRKYLGPAAKDGIRKVVKEKIEVFGSANKA